MESQKLKTQKLKCYVLGPKSQKKTTWGILESAKPEIYLYVSNVNSKAVSNANVKLNFRHLNGSKIKR